MSSLSADRAALRAALAAGLAHDPAGGLLLATKLARFWWANAGDVDTPGSRTLPTVHEGLDWLRRLLAVAEADPSTIIGGQVALGFLHGVTGDHVAAREVLLEARVAAAAIGEKRTGGWAAAYLANAAWEGGSDEAAAYYREAGTLLAQAGDTDGEATAALLEFTYHLRTAGAAVAEDALQRFLTLTAGTRSPTMSTYRQGALTMDALARGDLVQARDPLRRAMTAIRSTTDPATTSILLGICAWFAALIGAIDTAALLLAVAEDIDARTGLRFKQSSFGRELTREVLGPQLTPAIEATARQQAVGVSVQDALRRVAEDLLT